MSTPRKLFFLITGCHLLFFSSLACGEKIGDGPLRTLAGVRALTAREAAANVPVEVKGIVIGTHINAEGNTCIIHDGNAGCHVRLADAAAPLAVKAGDAVVVRGTSVVLGYFPSIGNAEILSSEPGELPPARPIGPQDLFSPRFDSSWVEVPAVITGFASGDGRFTLSMEVFGFPIKAEMPLEESLEERITGLMQRPVKLRGVLATLFNRQRQMTGRHFYVPNLAAITPVANPSGSRPAMDSSVDELLSGNNGPDLLVRVRGAITQGNITGFYLRDPSGSTLVQAPLWHHLPPGSQVEVEGYATPEPFRPGLRAVAVTVVTPGDPVSIAPQPFQLASNKLPMMHAELVLLEDVELLGMLDGVGESILNCRTGNRFFEARLPKENGFPAPMSPGDRVNLVGICELTTTHELPRMPWIDGFRLHLASPAAITVVSKAPWWTPRLSLAALGVMSTLAALGMTGTWLMRRQVKRQMEVIGHKLRSEAVGHERDRMARELHDTLEQQLVGVALQLDGLQSKVLSNPAEASAALNLARRMLRHTRSEARRSVWDLRSKILQNQGLEAALGALAKSASITNGPEVVFSSDGRGPALPFGGDFHLLRITQEALANALKHGSATRIEINLHQSPGELVLTIRDNGRGFDPGHSPTPGSHFGLLGMRERASKINARLQLDSRPGHGCAIRIRVPRPAPTSTPPSHEPKSPAHSDS